jgi:PAS domain S-box-containing protein
MPDAVVVAASDGNITFVNRAAEALFGYDQGELVGRPVEILIPSRFRAGHRTERELYTAAPRVRPMGLGLELRALAKDGREIAVEISLAPLLEEGEQLTIAAVRDVSQRKALEEQARQAEQAELEIRHRDEILAVASHELRGPVGTVELQVGMLQHAAADAIEDLYAMVARMKKIERNASHLGRLVGGLLDLRQLHDRTLRLKLEEADLAELTREAAERVRDVIEKTGATLTLAMSAAVRGRWDPVRLDQVVTNLLVNAAKFGRGKPIAVAVEGDADHARIVVSDEGVGIAADDQERIFEKFQQAGSPLDEARGVGLGLHISRQIVQAHGGRILLRSSVGSGSTFTVELPRETKVSAAG